MNKLLALSTLLLSTTCFAGGGASAGWSSTFRPVTCPQSVKASQCGYVNVPLDHAKPHGRQIELFVAVQKDSSKTHQLDPVFYLEGGPGAPSSISVGPLAQAFPDRDVVGIDQRGVGESQPTLRCEEKSTHSGFKPMVPESRSRVFSDTITNCVATLRKQGVQLEYFNTTQAAKDVELVRRALGYGQINLYGASYGTRLAQEVLRYTPQHIRAAVLDSVIPASLDRVAKTAEAVELALDRVIQACQADANCKARYPDLKADYLATLKKLDAQPLRVSSSSSTEAVDARTFQAIIMGSLYFTPGIEEIPGLITAARDRRSAPFETSFSAKVGEVISDKIAWGAFYSNECVGEVAYSSPAALEQGLKNAPGFAKALTLIPGISSADIFNLCRDLRLIKAAPMENEAVATDVLVLLLAGEFDPVTPASWLPQAMQKMPRAQSVVISGAAHASGLTGECGYGLVTSFLKDPVKPIDATCADKGKVNFK